MPRIELDDHDADGRSAPELNVMILYEDAETGHRAERSLAAVQAGGLLGTGLRTRLWRRDLLQAAWLRERAASEAASADVIIISVHGQDGLPEEVRAWLGDWVERKAERPCALGLLLDRPVGAHERANPIAAYVQTVAAAAGADVLWGSCGTGHWGRAGSLAGTSERPAAGRWDGTAERYPMGRQSHWGINE
jgi:hypothetical protein